MEEVSQWGGGHGSEVCKVGTEKVEVSVVGTSGSVVVSVGDTGRRLGFVVMGGPVDTVESSGTSGGLDVVVWVVLSVVGAAADQEVLSEEAVEEVTREAVVSVIFRGGAAAVVVVGEGTSDTVDSCMVTLFVVVLQSVAAEVGVGLVVGATCSGADVGDSEAAVEAVFSSVGVTCRILSVVTGGAVVSGLMTGVVLLVVKGLTGVTDSGVKVTVGKDVVPVSTGGGVGRGEEVVEAGLGKPAGMGLVVVGGRRSSVTGLILVTVYAVVAVLGTVVLSVTVDVSETGAGLREVTMGVTAADSVVASVVSLVVWATTGRGVVVAVGPSMELVLGAAVVDVCGAAPVVVKNGCRASVGLVEEVSQNRAVMVKGALLVLDVLGLNGPLVELTVLVVHAVVSVTVVGGASVSLTVDGSSGPGVRGSVGGVVPAVLDSSGAAEGGMVGERVGWSGAGGALDEVVCVLTAGVEGVTLSVGPVGGGVEDVGVVVLRGVVEAAVPVVVAEVTAAEVGGAVDGVAGCTVTGPLIPETRGGVQSIILLQSEIRDKARGYSQSSTKTHRLVTSSRTMWAGQTGRHPSTLYSRTADRAGKRHH